ncbi:hypothetical protein [Pseudoclavibacter helvolus]|uniref:Transcriptional regulator with XRE-family HTH domain n=1 Tax=Pseudoclavibacter helvolus TaxID=255205 RepID=A0A7W4UMT4_9MICO|nr:hypothetical protein [Pseudoclavibacter helvolus]MBB2957293.1 transcriptional regulator with XRE-family HTH domain [Pseudoclavibacter helvolus]
MTRYNDLTPFSIAFAAAYRGFMAENNVTGKQIAAKLGRNTGYVSERINGKRALDTEDIDALAMLAGGGLDGGQLFLELARRASDSSTRPDNVTAFPGAPDRTELTEEQELRYAADTSEVEDEIFD